MPQKCYNPFDIYLFKVNKVCNAWNLFKAYRLVSYSVLLTASKSTTLMCFHCRISTSIVCRIKFEFITCLWSPCPTIPSTLANYMFKVFYRSTRTRYKTCSKLAIKVSLLSSGVFILNFEHISHIVLVFLLLNYEQVNYEWVLIRWSFAKTNVMSFHAKLEKKWI